MDDARAERAEAVRAEFDRQASEAAAAGPDVFRQWIENQVTALERSDAQLLRYLRNLRLLKGL